MRTPHVAPQPLSPVIHKLLIEAFKFTNSMADLKLLVLEIIEDHPTSVAHIANILRTNRQSIRWVAQKLVAEGSCELTENYLHRRAKLLKLTSSGRKLLVRGKSSLEDLNG
jgi:DNA-binding MarR family transcriptional regulator